MKPSLPGHPPGPSSPPPSPPLRTHPDPRWAQPSLKLADTKGSNPVHFCHGLYVTWPLMQFISSLLIQLIFVFVFWQGQANRSRQLCSLTHGYTSYYSCRASRTENVSGCGWREKASFYSSHLHLNQVKQLQSLTLKTVFKKRPWGTFQKSVPRQSFSPSSEGWGKSLSQLGNDERLFPASSLQILSTSQRSWGWRREDEHHHLSKSLHIQEGSGSSGVAGLQPSKKLGHRGSTAISKQHNFCL